MKIRRNSGTGTAAVLLLACILACFPALAADPVLPHLFYGEVTFSTLPAPAGTHITAMDNGAVVAEYFTEYAGSYGSTELTGNKFKVQGDIENGEEITFYINGAPAVCYPVDEGGPWLSSYPFSSGEETQLNLSITQPVYIITASAGTGGTISPSGDIFVSEGNDKVFTITPDDGYRIDDVTVDGVSVGALSVYSFVNVTKNHNITAFFEAGPPEYFTVILGEGWNLFSTPMTLAAGHEHLEDIFPEESLDNIEVVLGWDGSQWFLTGYGYELKPLYAVYVKVHGTATARLYPASIPPGPLPPHHLGAGWNLIATTPPYESGGFPPVPVDEALVTIYEFQGGLPGYATVVSPGFNQPFWVYQRDGQTSYDILAYKGYWVYMINPGDLGGFSYLPT